MFILVEVNFFDAHVKMAFVFTFNHSHIFEEFFACGPNIWDSLHTPRARCLAYRGLHVLTWEFVEMLNNWVFPI